MRRLTKHARATIGQRIEIKWSVSRGRDTGGYTVASLRDNAGRLRARCNGGGYDMRGTVLGSWIADEYREELLRLRPGDMPANSHWQPERARVCDGQCRETYRKAQEQAIIDGTIAAFEKSVQEVKLPEDCFTCPSCGGPTRASRDGKRIDDGRSFYGLRFFDPDYDPGKAIVGKDCSDRTFGKEGENEGKTVAQVEKEGQSVGLERLQAFYSATSPHPTRKHRVPTIDGGCGTSCVLHILNAIGLELEKVADLKHLDVYIIRQHHERSGR